MAKRRMISVDIMEKDGFIALSPAAQAYYVHLHLSADDDGLVGNAVSLLRMYGFPREALDALTNAGYVLRFESGVCAIRHWPVSNKVKPDRYTPTVHAAEFALLETVPGEGYRLKQSASAADASPIPHPASAGEHAPASAGEHAPASEANISTSLPLSTGENYAAPEERLGEYRTLYPAVDVPQELRNMRGWLIAHPDKRRTAAEMDRFMNHWLMTAQEKAGREPQKKNGAWQNAPPGALTSRDLDRAEYLMNTRVPKLKKREDRRSR